MGRRLLASAAIAAGAAAAALLLLVSATDLIAEGLRSADAVVAVAVHAVGIALLLWYLVTSLVATVCLLARAAGTAWEAGEDRLRTLGAPLARRLLVTGAGAVVAAGAVLAPAQAGPIEPEPTPTVSDDLGWGAGTSEEPTDSGGETSGNETSSADPAPRTTSPTEATPVSASDDDPQDSDDVPDDVETYLVQPGDTLWDIAGQHLDDPSDAEIAAAWPAWYRTNVDVIGSDPDVIHPGQVLQAPDHELLEEA